MQPAKQLPDETEQRRFSKSSASGAARVAYSLAWFGFGPFAPSHNQPTHFQHHYQQLQQMSLHDWQQLEQEALVEPIIVPPRRWKTPERKGWVDKVAARALKASSSSINKSEHPQATRDHLWRSRQGDGGIWGAPVRLVAGMLTAAQQSAQGCVEAVQATGQTAAASVQRVSYALVTPVQQAAQRMVSRA